uniref:Variant surface glycoprotein (VSG), putative n=1 Tax=Trypanosoma brucei brucei (strain 927/4 GUTat10.1) TaxID=185431 RepID=Q4FKQ7_TRYB2|nr:variant surface glycoprotein (VSG), putative [Trypanosoma brucei brucei TREU927]
MKSPESAVIVSLLLATVTPLAQAATEAIKASSLQPYCQYSIQAKGQAQALQNSISTALADLKGYSKLAKAMKLGALTNGRRAIGFATLSLYAATKAENARQQLEAKAGTNIVNAAKAAYTAGHIDDFVNVLYRTTATTGTHNTNTCLDHTSNSDTAVRQILSGCLDDGFAAPPQDTPKISTLLKANTGTYSSADLTGSRGCTLFTAHTTVFTGAAPASGVEFGGGMFTTHATPAVTDQTRLKKLTAADTIAKHKTSVEALETATQAAQKTAPATIDEVIALINAAQNNGELTTALSKLLNKGEEIQGAKLKAMLETALGKDFEKDTGAMATALKNLKAQNPQNKQQTPVLELEEIDLDVAIAQKLQTTATTEKQAATCTDAFKHSNPEEFCNEIEEQEKCEKTPGCHYNKTKEGKKCTLSEAGKKQAAEKANQETGGKDGKTSSDCKGKQQKDCTGNCKWEGTECKDSSILVNKKFALSVVSAL